MPNIVGINNSGRGFIMLSNDLADSLCKIDLSAREFRVFLAIFRLTSGWNKKTARLPAELIADKTGLRRDVASRVLGALLERRVVYRLGGSHGDIGICEPAEWVMTASKGGKKTKRDSAEILPIESKRHLVTKTSISDENVTHESGSICDENVTLPHLYTNNNIPTEYIRAQSAVKKSAKPKAKAAAPKKPSSKFGIAQMLADNPHNLPEQLLTDWIAVRKAKRAAMTLTAWQKLNRELTALALRGVSAEQGLTVAVEAGWQGFEADWVVNRLSQGGGFAGSPVAAKPQAPDFHSGDTSWADALDMEDF